MSEVSPKLIHVAPWIRGIGGVETLMRHHRAEDPRSGFDAQQISLFDKQEGAGPPGYSTQRFSWRDTPARMRRNIAATFAAAPGRIVLWHGWGVPWFADIDASSRRIVCLWENEPQFEPWLRKIAHLVDGVTFMSKASGEAAARLLPHLPAERLLFLPVPIAPPDSGGAESVREPGREIVIGCAGRLVKTPKRWERLIPFVAELKRLGVSFRIEIVSDGPMRAFLERQLGSNPAVHFLGWQENNDYWTRLRSWDAAVFFSDFEGGPIVMLEAMAVGALPFYPQAGGSLGDDYAPRIHPDCYYPAGNPEAAARAVQKVFALPSAELAQSRARARELVAVHSGAEYQRRFAGFVQAIARMPRISAAPASQRLNRLTDQLPLGAVTRFLPWTLWR